ncbi:hypothetical protein [Helicobacter sp. 11S03491-1]|uniref:hypothetical protein n=1 Tax=Helicobacter sp. 11S03491-1 TaxID=1476196 RepID=UPI000BA5D4BC|nr:hypothetical protein [Helicobacter sp. 11S03491-1]PAF42939.1 hypothetical protein BKH45_02405 [Helicobacter sp. 11S03491-1]
MNKKSKNIWPYGILAVIIIGVILLVMLVRLSIEDPIIDDNAYFEKYNDVDKNINTIMKDTKEFETYYSVYIDANQKPSHTLTQQPLSPYFIKGHRDKLKQSPKIELFTNTPNQFYVSIVPKISPSPVGDIQISLFLSRFHMEKQDLQLGVLKCDSHGLCISKDFNLNVDGRWKAILQIQYIQNNEIKKIFLEKEFFASKHS